MTATTLVGVLCVVALLIGSWVLQWRVRVARRFEASDATRRPRDEHGVVIGADAIRLAGSNGQAVLVLHGFNDTPQSMAHLCARLNAAGYTVHAPRLPGHGCGLPELAREARASAWRAHAADSYAALVREHRAVYVCGQSMGGALATLLAVEYAQMPALVLLAPYLGVTQKMSWTFTLAALSPAKYHKSLGGERSIHDHDARMKALGPGIVTGRALLALRTVAREAEAALGRLRVPTLYMQSRQDNRISEADALRHFASIGAADKRQLWLNGSGHIISADYERDVVADAVIAWFGAHRA